MSHPRVSRRGQSLIEAMIALSVLTAGFMGIATLLARSFFLNRVISDRITANYLAVEGLEIAKNLIDHDVYESASGDPSFFWGKCFSSTGDVQLDYTTTGCGTLTAFVIPGNPLMLNPTTHLYGYNPAGAVATYFTREVRVVEAGNEITVDSIVRWSTGAAVNQSIDLENVFYNWQP